MKRLSSLARGVVIVITLMAMLRLAPQAFAAEPFPTSGSSCGGNLQWQLVQNGTDPVSQAGQASGIRVCQSGFSSIEDISTYPQGYTFEVSWAELDPFRQRFAGVSTFYSEDLSPANIQQFTTGSPGNYTICTTYPVVGWASDNYCGGVTQTLLSSCMNGFNIDCNANVRRFWRPDQEPFENVWSDILIPASRGELDEVATRDNRDEIMLSKFDLCRQVPGSAGDPSTQRGKCVECLQSAESVDANGETQVNALYTAVGCIRLGERELTEDLVRLFMGIVGGIALMTILFAAFLFSVSQGDTNKVKQAKELMTAAVTGLLFIIFSIFVLQFIGVNILGIPGLGA